MTGLYSDPHEELISAQAQLTRAEAIKAEKDVNHPARFITSARGRQWIYGVLVAGGAVAVGYGLLTVEEAGLWLALAGAGLVVGPGLAAVNAER